MWRTIFTLQRKNTTSSAKHEKSEVWWLLYNVNNLASNGLQTTLVLSVALFDTPIKNIYWRSVAETDLKNVSTFISQLGTCNWNFYNQLLNFLNSEVLSSFDLFNFFWKGGRQFENYLHHLHIFRCIATLSPPLLALLQGNSIPRGNSPPQQGPLKSGEPLPWLQWVSEYGHNTLLFTF